MFRIGWILIVFLGAFELCDCAPPPPPPPPFEPTMIYKPIDLSNQRIQLTENYLCQYYQICQGSVDIMPRMIVIHWTGTLTLQDAFNSFQPAETATGQLNNSVQFIVARSGTVYQLMPSNWMARHVVALDYLAINISNVGGTGGEPNLTQRQVEADAYLIRMLKKQYPSIDYLIGHQEYLSFERTRLWKGFSPSDAPPVNDPGLFFMSLLRAKVQDLGLQGGAPL